MVRIGIFGKVFLYTLAFLVITILVAAAVFAQQFIDYYNYLQIRQYTAVFEPLKTSVLEEGSMEKIVKIADSFHDKNQSYSFRIETKEGTVVYTTTQKEPLDAEPSVLFGTSLDSAEGVIRESAGSNTRIDIKKDNSGATSGASATIYGTSMVMNLDDDLLLRMSDSTERADLKKTFAGKVFMVTALLLCFSVLGAVFLARGITRPIKRLAEDATRMANLETVSHPDHRSDEVGQLAKDVHRMYEKLKLTISELENEIRREKEMEENQRYFFSAASHELKTPIAAASALLEGMLAGIGDYKNHPKYLRECLNMMNTQNRIITAILKIVTLSDQSLLPQREEVAILHVISSLLPEYEPLAEKKGQSIMVDVPATASCFTDRVMFSNVISNVMMNAIQNSPEGEQIFISWERSAAGPEQDCSGLSETTSETCRVIVKNTNAAIDDEIKQRLFDPFFRADKARSRGEGRSGLGLTIVKRILDTLEVPFELQNEGTDVVFKMELPCFR
ncbi:HAMP domain-containing histidine kinase [Anoxybacterium hadale]|uniref:HAMP domain-containing histidine kinase n=1 Tax=Anoxybacterium hadale TaxID=3408580 RepID=A0ACD1AAJ7_9FIRM|nr:HAMP domain-containing histidine kinase [Clostridiales bacterium]